MKRGNYQTDSSFARIVAGEASCWKIFETEHSVAMLSSLSIARGHSVLAAKYPWTNILDAQTDRFSAFMADLPILARAVQAATKCDGISIVQSNGKEAAQGIFHLHVHVIPRYKKESFNPLTKSLCQDGQLLDSENALPLLTTIKRQLPPTLCGWSLFLQSEEETTNVGNTLSHVVQPGDVITLSGELGAGKTCVARGIIRSFFHNPTMDIPSPSFLLCLSYAPDHSDHNKLEYAQGEGDEDGEGKKRKSPESSAAAQEKLRIPTIHHMDPFRLRANNLGKMTALVDFESALRDDISIIEWPERLGSDIIKSAPNRLEIRIDGVGPQGQGRWMSFKGVGERWEKIIAEWARRDEMNIPEGSISYNASSSICDPLDANPAKYPKKQAKVELPALPADPLSWIVLGIDSSCDDTGVAIVRGDGVILGEELASQTGLHDNFGGVKPDVAQAAHKNAINRTVDTAFAKAGIDPSQLTAVAVTIGPGLSLCLEVGVRKALEIAATYSLPLVKIHHMEAHALVTRLPGQGSKTPEFPTLTLLVSGGHNMLVYSKGVGNHMIVGSTLDDSVGEAFDKTARLLGIDVIPGGPLLEKLAEKGDPKVYQSQIKVPLSQSKVEEMRTGCDFSFAGLKTGVRSLVKSEEERIQSSVDEGEREAALQEMRQNIAARFQQVSVMHLSERTQRALARIQQHEKVNCLVVAGGVAANKSVRSEITRVATEAGVEIVCPPLRLCTDNGVMIAWAGVERLRLNLHTAPPEMENYGRHVEVLPRWPIGPRDPRSIMKSGGL